MKYRSVKNVTISIWRFTYSEHDSGYSYATTVRAVRLCDCGFTIDEAPGSLVAHAFCRIAHAQPAGPRVRKAAMQWQWALALNSCLSDRMSRS